MDSSLQWEAQLVLLSRTCLSFLWLCSSALVYIGYKAVGWFLFIMVYFACLVLFCLWSFTYCFYWSCKLLCCLLYWNRKVVYSVVVFKLNKMDTCHMPVVMVENISWLISKFIQGAGDMGSTSLNKPFGLFKSLLLNNWITCFNFPMIKILWQLQIGEIDIFGSV